MVSSIGSLANMEYMLYGGASGLNTNTPSYMNGYMANRGLYGNYYNPYNNYNNYGNYSPKSVFSTPNTISDTNKTGASTSNKDLDTLGDYYMKSMNPSESLAVSAVSGAAFSLMTNLRFIAHPWNSLSTVGMVEKMFADVKTKGTKMYELWRNPETHKLMTDAYARMHKLEGGAKPRLGLFKSRLDKDLYDLLKARMETALKSGNKEAIATVTEEIRIATNAKTGYIPQGWRKLKGALDFNSKTQTIAEKIADKNAVSAAVNKNIAEKSSKTISEYFKHGLKGQGGLGGAVMFGIEYLMDAGKIKAAFSKDKETGWKQVGQTTAKGVSALIGWAAGEAVGAWAGAKLGALAGTAIAPGVGTVIGAVAGLVGGSIGVTLMGKFTKKIIGEDVGSKVEIENMKKTPEGQAQLLSLTAMQAQNDKKLDPKVLRALQNVAAQYS